jgi:hypothetical protein
MSVLPALASAGITFRAENTHRRLRAEVTAGNQTDVALTIPPTDPLALWSHIAEASATFGDPVDDINANATGVQHSSASPGGITLAGSAQGSVGFQASIDEVESHASFDFDVDSCMQYFADASLGESNAGQGMAEFFQFHAAVLEFDPIIELKRDQPGEVEDVVASTGQISPGRYIARGESFLNDLGDRGSYFAPNYALGIGFLPCDQPLIAQQPQGQLVAAGATASLSVVASPTVPPGPAAGDSGLSGASALTYQWRRSGQALVDDGRISGATTANLQIAGFGSADQGGYTVVVNDGTTQAFSSMAIVALGAPDVDGDGIPDAEDRCPRYASPQQTDTDGDGRGDVCECGDQNGDTVSDLVAINRAIFNPGQVTPLCDANGDSNCNVADIVGANVEIFSPTNSSTCSRQPVPGP